MTRLAILKKMLLHSCQDKIIHNSHCIFTNTITKSILVIRHDVKYLHISTAVKIKLFITHTAYLQTQSQNQYW